MTLDVEIDREGARVIVAVRDAKGRGVTLDLARGAASTLAATISVAAAAEEDTSHEYALRGELTTTTTEKT